MDALQLWKLKFQGFTKYLSKKSSISCKKLHWFWCKEGEKSDEFSDFRFEKLPFKQRICEKNGEILIKLTQNHVISKGFTK